jgi:hypothetical protein
MLILSDLRVLGCLTADVSKINLNSLHFLDRGRVTASHRAPVTLRTLGGPVVRATATTSAVRFRHAA